MVKQSKGTRITISLSGGDHAELSAIAEKYDASMSWVARQAIADFLDRHRTGDMQLPLNLPRTGVR